MRSHCWHFGHFSVTSSRPQCHEGARCVAKSRVCRQLLSNVYTRSTVSRFCIFKNFRISSKSGRTRRAHSLTQSGWGAAIRRSGCDSTWKPDSDVILLRRFYWLTLQAHLLWTNHRSSFGYLRDSTSNVKRRHDFSVTVLPSMCARLYQSCCSKIFPPWSKCDTWISELNPAESRPSARLRAQFFAQIIQRFLKFRNYAFRIGLCSYSGYKIYPGHGKTMVKADGKVTYKQPIFLEFWLYVTS